MKEVFHWVWHFDSADDLRQHPRLSHDAPQRKAPGRKPLLDDEHVQLLSGQSSGRANVYRERKHSRVVRTTSPRAARSTDEVVLYFRRHLPGKRGSGRPGRGRTAMRRRCRHISARSAPGLSAALKWWSFLTRLDRICRQSSRCLATSCRYRSVPRNATRATSVCHPRRARR